MIQVNDSVLCTVEKIESNTVFVLIDSTKQKGTIVISEIAPGRIRNIRDYVVPNKKIVCKVLRVTHDHFDLSLRRVNAKERDELMEAWKTELTTKSAFRKILGENAQKTEEKILASFPSLSDFIAKAKEDAKIIEEYLPKEVRELISRLTQKKQKEIEVKKIVNLQCLDEPDGILRIKSILLSKNQKAEILYISAGKFQISIKSDDYKKANHLLDSMILEMEKESKSKKCEFRSD